MQKGFLMTSTELRPAFKAWLQERYPNDHNVSATVSMAFFAQRHGDELGLDFERIFTQGTAPEDYRQRLKVHFAQRGRKNPSGNASVYAHSLRLLFECMNDTICGFVPHPTPKEVRHYLTKWDTLPNYKAQEDALHLLFREIYPDNTDLRHVLLKCSMLNDFYGTNIYGVYPMAKHIIALSIDERLRQGDPQLVDDIASGHGIKHSSGKERQLFSFATKYCSHHNPEDYPIYDSYVEQLLLFFRKKDGFADFRNADLRDFPLFKQIILQFRAYYGLEQFSVKQIDQYLWQLGKDKFPKY